MTVRGERKENDAAKACLDSGRFVGRFRLGIGLKIEQLAGLLALPEAAWRRIVAGLEAADIERLGQVRCGYRHGTESESEHENERARARTRERERKREEKEGGVGWTMRRPGVD